MATANTLEGPVLELVDECKIGKLLPDDGIDRWEASGIQAKGHYLYVIFDNLPHIARFHSSLKIGHPHHVLVRQRGASPGFEDITLNKEDG